MGPIDSVSYWHLYSFSAFQYCTLGSLAWWLFMNMILIIYLSQSLIMDRKFLIYKCTNYINQTVELSVYLIFRFSLVIMLFESVQWKRQRKLRKQCRISRTWPTIDLCLSNKNPRPDNNVFTPPIPDHILLNWTLNICIVHYFVFKLTSFKRECYTCNLL